MSIVSLQRSENRLLNREEVQCTFKGLAGMMTRSKAIEMVAKSLDVKAEQVYLVSLEGRSGTRDVRARFYIFQNDVEAKRQLPEYLVTRHLPPDERKKLLEERRKAKQSKAAGRK